MVTEPGPLVTPNVIIPPGFKSPSVTVVVGVQSTGPGHRTLIRAAVGTPASNPPAALRVKSTSKAGLIGVKVTVTGLVVPGVNAGIVTIALIGVPNTVSDCNPIPALT